MLQHALFVGQYLRVALALPLIFCYQNDRIVEQRVSRIRWVRGAEIFFAVFCATMFLVQVLDKHVQDWIATLLWNISAEIIAIVLVLSFSKLKKWQHRVNGVLCNELLMNMHSVFFLTATFFDLIAISIKAVAKWDRYVTEAAKLRLDISFTVFNTAGVMAWFGVQVLILLVFVKYGKPLQNDAKVLISN